MNKPLEDRVVISTMLISVGVGVVLMLMRIVGHFAVPAQLMMLFLGAAVCGLTYRFLGGVGDAKLQTPLVTIGGTASLYLALLMWVGPTLDDQFNKSEANPLIKENSELVKELDRKQLINTQLQEKLDSKTEMNAESVIAFIKNQPPTTKFIDEIVEMVHNGGPPFAAPEETVRISAIRFEGSDAYKYNVCQKTYDRLFPNGSGNSNLMLSRTIDEAGQQKTVKVSYKGRIQRDVCDNEDRKIDMQISCIDAASLFQLPEISDCLGADKILGARILATSSRSYEAQH